MKALKFAFLFFGFFGMITGCENYKHIRYFENLSDSANLALTNAKYKNLLIQPDDILSISVQTIDPAANAIFNQNMSVSAGTSNVPGGAMGGNQPALGGYLVDKNGEIELPLLGKIKVGGLTTYEARDSIESKASGYYKIPTVNVRFINFKINVLGEVARPGTYILPNEKNTIFDALGLAGDITIFGKRENALLIRDSAGQSKLIRFSLNDKDLITKDFFFLKQNDVIYIEPNKRKIASTDAIATRNYSIIVSVLTVIIVFISRITVKL